MKKMNYLNVLAVFFIVAAAPVLFAAPAQAYVYDHFASAGIDPNLWDDRGPNTGLFFQPGTSYLYFNDSSGGQTDGLRSHNPVSGAFFVSMEYSNFFATNDTTTSGQASGMQLRLGGSDYVIVEEIKNHNGLEFNALSFVGGSRTVLNYVRPGNYDSGRLGIYYNGILGTGGEVDLYYDYGAGWFLLASSALDLSTSPYFLIRGVDTYGEKLSFQVDKVELTPIPLPPGALLLGSGLLGLVGWRRFSKG